MIAAVSTFRQAFINLIGWIPLVIVWVSSFGLAYGSDSSPCADR